MALVGMCTITWAIESMHSIPTTRSLFRQRRMLTSSWLAAAVEAVPTMAEVVVPVD